MDAPAGVEQTRDGMLRFVTAGSVDDGKSTLIGRLLYDSKGVFEDQLSAVERASLRLGRGEVDLALLTDGLQAEREQGITIDVAYRYFATPRRKFIIADSPGHEQYTRNMVTGASTAQAAVILVDARKGVLDQTRRHAYLAALLGIPHLIFAVNKMDLVGYDARTFAAIRARLEEFAPRLASAQPWYVPISALLGDNVVAESPRLPWYDGPTLLELLEGLDVEPVLDAAALRFPVQGVARPAGAASGNEPNDFRGYAGRIESGSVAVGDDVTVLPSNLESRVRAIHTFDGRLERAMAPQSITLLLADDIDTSRGDLIVRAGEHPAVARDLVANLCWLANAPLDLRRRYYLKHTTRLARASVSEIEDRLDIATLSRVPAPDTLRGNDIGRVRIKVQQPLAFDPYPVNRVTGSFILIDEATNDTVAAGLIEHG